MGRVDSDID